MLFSIVGGGDGEEFEPEIINTSEEMPNPSLHHPAHCDYALSRANALKVLHSTIAGLIWVIAPPLLVVLPSLFVLICVIICQFPFFLIMLLLKDFIWFRMAHLYPKTRTNDYLALLQSLQSNAV